MEVSTLTKPRSKDNRGVTSIPTIGRIGQSVNIAIERFATVGEKIADDNDDIRAEMYEACKEARSAGTSLERLCDIIANNSLEYTDINGTLNIRNTISRTSKSLISSITRVLLLADIDVVKRLLLSKDKVTKSLDKLESVVNFTEFVKAFSSFGGEMVEFTYLTGDNQNKLKEERRRTEIGIARQVLERSTVTLLTSSKTCLMHSECAITKENRDTVFCQIRRAMDLIHFVVKDGVTENAIHTPRTPTNSEAPAVEWANDRNTLYFALLNFSRLLNLCKQKALNLSKSFPNVNNSSGCEPSQAAERKFNSSGDQDIYQASSTRKTDVSPYHNQSISPAAIKNGKNTTECFKVNDRFVKLNPAIREMLLSAMDKIVEKTEDFTDSAYTNHETRENILLLCQRCKLKLNQCLRIAIDLESETFLCSSSLIKLNKTFENVLIAVKDLSDQLILSVSDQIFDLHHSLKMTLNIVINFRSYAINQELDRFHGSINSFHDYCDHVLDVCKLFQHVSATDSLQIQSKFSESNIRVYGPQVINAARILYIYPSSRVAHDNFDAFLTMWQWLITDVTVLCDQIVEIKPGKKLADSTDILNFSKPGSPEKVSKSINSSWLEDEQKKIEDSGLEIKRLSNEIEEETDKWKGESTENNDIVKRAKNMSSMAFLMYQFTKGDGALRTTQDLFTQAEYFAEEANRLYKIVRQFSYQVPAGTHKKDLLDNLDKVPTYVQALQFSVKDHTVGKAATFVKVDQVIRETKNLMNAINKVTTACFECANEYKLDFNELSGRAIAGYPRDDESGAAGMGDSKGTTSITEGSM